MSDIVIRTDGLSKRYRIGDGEPSADLRDTLAHLAGRLLLRKRTLRTRRNEIWALKGVSFELRRGEILAMIGRNGAGKSTLLKILTRITEPTEGYAQISGRTGCLLEVGTGFHPDLTGRENVYLNGAILGMKKAEINRNFDAIVEFSGVERFIDTPVKYYSSGMHVRLAFSVAAHLDPEVLFIDEVLAVGDADFQKKCITQMRSLAQRGATVVFVSHSLSTVRELCTRAFFIDSGHIAADGAPSDVIDLYQSTVTPTHYRASPNPVVPTIYEAAASWGTPDQIAITVSFTAPFQLHQPVIGFALYDAAGTLVFGTRSGPTPCSTIPSGVTHGTVTVCMDATRLIHHSYLVSLALSDQDSDYCHLDRVLRIDPPASRENSQVPGPPIAGNIFFPTRWSYTHSPVGPTIVDHASSMLVSDDGHRK